MIKKVIFYCHGYDSSAQTDKVRRIKNMSFDVMAHDIDLDPTVSLPYLEEVVSDWCIDFFNAQNLDICFVGTSLGAWYANRLGRAFGAETVLINPALDPADSLKKYGVPEELIGKYEAFGPIEFTRKETVVIAKDDEVLTFPEGVDWCHPATLIEYATGGHRFNGPELEDALRRALSAGESPPTEK